MSALNAVEKGAAAVGAHLVRDVSLPALVLGNDGAVLHEWALAGRGLAWLVDWLNERYDRASCVVIDGRNGVDVLVERIRPTWKAKNAVLRPSARDVIASVGLFTTTVNERGLTWYKPQQALAESAVTSTKRPISGGYGFGGDNSLPLAISADAKTPHQAVITAMDAAGKLGFSHLRITTVEAQAEQP